MRVTFWDNSKGIAIVAVVMIHVIGAVVGDTPSGSWQEHFYTLFRQFINFPVALFFFIAGYFSLSQSGIFEFYKKRISRIAIPYVVWALVYAAFSTTPESIVAFVKSLISGGAVGVGYFVVVLLQLVCLTPFLQMIRSRRIHISIILVCIVLSVSFTYYFQIFAPQSALANFPLNALFFFIWMPFYHLGYYLCRYSKEWECQRISVLFIFYAITLVLSIIESSIWSGLGSTFALSQLKITTMLNSLVVCLIVFALRNKCQSHSDRFSLLTWLGKNSYVIYLSHILLLGAIRTLIQPGTLLYSFAPAYLLVVTVATLLACSVIALLLRVIFTGKVSQRLFG